MARELVRFHDCIAEQETAKALRVWIEDLEEHIWVPKSVIHDDSEVYKDGTTGELVVLEWWASKKGLT